MSEYRSRILYACWFFVIFVSLCTKIVKMVNIILLIFGGAFGAFMNTFVMQMVYNIVAQPSPRTVLLVNVVSCFTIGFASIFHYSQSLHFNTRLMLVLGLCGGFVVCSAFTRGNSTLLKSGLSATTLLYFSATIVLGIVAVLVGQLLASICNKF